HAAVEPLLQLQDVQGRRGLRRVGVAGRQGAVDAVVVLAQPCGPLLLLLSASQARAERGRGQSVDEGRQGGVPRQRGDGPVERRARRGLPRAAAVPVLLQQRRQCGQLRVGGADRGERGGGR